MELRDEAARAGDQAYGAVVVKDGKIVGEAAAYWANISRLHPGNRPPRL